ncbi:MAG: Glu-tRNA(Gln) amidotransferase subunit GatD [Euryarchaeota archaeon]
MSEYRGKVREFLSEHGVDVGDRVRVVREDGVELEGVIMPRSELGDDRHLVLKLDNGYNVGVRVDRIERLEAVGERREPSFRPLKGEIPEDPSLPNVVVMSTGGTIACRVDYETGAVKPAFTAEELVSAVPELPDVVNVADVRAVMDLLSENMEPRHWVRIAEEVADALSDPDVDGVVVAHGTDTMAYTAAALAFLLDGLPGPVVLVGAQRSSDRPSSDAASNLIAACRFAGEGEVGEVTVCMHGWTADEVCLVHRGVRVRKMHTSRRDAFRSIESLPIARVDVRDLRNPEVEYLREDYREPGEGEPELSGGFEERVALVKFAPGMDPEVLDFYVDRGYRGIVLEGTGLGHVSERWLDSIERAVDEGVAVVMTSQCLYGRVNMNVYRTGRLLRAAGVIPGEDMLPEVAYVKLMYVLNETDDPGEVERLMRTNLVGEIERGRAIGGFEPADGPHHRL